MTELVENSLGKGYKYEGCLLGKDGNIYGIPYNATRFAKFNPNDK